MGRIIFYLFFLIINTAPVFAESAQTANAGFVTGVWYSETPFFAGNEIRIYSAIQNQSGFDITGKVQFFDDDKLIGEESFSGINGRLIEKWVDWEVSQGDHKIYAKIVDAMKTEVGKEPEPLTLKFDSSATDNQFADLDTDGDRIGNRDDPDDDNDGLTDEEELEMGTDPLTPNEPTPEDSDKEDAAKTIDKTKQNLSETVTLTYQSLIGDITAKLEDDKEKIQKEIKGEKNPRPLFAESIREIEKKVPFLDLPEEKFPTGKHVHSWFIGALIYVVNSWLLFAIAVLLIIGLLWKLVKEM